MRRTVQEGPSAVHHATRGQERHVEATAVEGHQAIAIRNPLLNGLELRGFLGRVAHEELADLKGGAAIASDADQEGIGAGPTAEPRRFGVQEGGPRKIHAL